MKPQEHADTLSCMKWTYFILILNVLIFISACSAETDNPSQSLHKDSHVLLASKMTQQFLLSPERPSWDKQDLNSLHRAIEASAEHGLNPKDYHKERLEAGSLKQEERELLAIDAYFALATHLRDGKVDPQSYQAKWDIDNNVIQLASELTNALKNNRVEESLNTFAPQHQEYLHLKKALVELRDKSNPDNWKPIPSDQSLTPGMRSEHLVQVKKRLDKKVDAEADDSNLYDKDLETAVKQFQRNASLTPDGVLGPETIEKLNVSLENKREIIRVNMERWRWLPDDLGKRHVRVSIADYSLQAYDNGRIVGNHDVVVGKVYRQTPMFSDEISHLVINPWWIVPHSLAVKDLLPKFQNNPDIIQEKHYEIRDRSEEVVDPEDINWEDYSKTRFPFEVRQKPGSENALGRIKFIFPNKHDVYLHDTPAQHLFDKTQRDFSSGCIRVKNPFALAQWILDDKKNWDKQQLISAVEDGKKRTLTLDKPLPIHLVYWTVIVKGDTLQFPADIYDRDNKVLAALNTPSPDS